jgi:TonB family protein
MNPACLKKRPAPEHAVRKTGKGASQAEVEIEEGGQHPATSRRGTRMFDQIPASSETPTERPRIRRRVIVALVLFVVGSAFLHISMGSSVAAMSSYWRNAGPPDLGAVSVITLSRSIRDTFLRPAPTPTPKPVIAKRTVLHIAQLKYREIGTVNPSPGRRATLAQHVSLISMQRPEKSKNPSEDSAPRVAATEVPSAPSHSATSASADTGGSSDELASSIVWGDDNPARIVRETALPSGLTATSRPARVQVEVGPDGNVLSVMLIQSSGDSAVDDAALAAAKQSLFAPATLNGLPVHGTCVLDFSTGANSPA